MLKKWIQVKVMIPIFRAFDISFQTQRAYSLRSPIKSWHLFVAYCIKYLSIVLPSRWARCLTKHVRVFKNLSMKNIYLLSNGPASPTSYTKWINKWTWESKNEVGMCISSKVRTIALSLSITKSSYLSISLAHTHHTIWKNGQWFHRHMYGSYQDIKVICKVPK